MMRENEIKKIASEIRGKSRYVLKLIRDNPGITGTKIQEISGWKTGKSFYNHVKVLVKNSLIQNSIGKDRRTKEYQITEKGRKVLEEKEISDMRNSLSPFFALCESFYQRLHPQRNKSPKLLRLITFKKEYNDSFILKLKTEVLEFIDDFIS